MAPALLVHPTACSCNLFVIEFIHSVKENSLADCLLVQLHLFAHSIAFNE